VVYLWNTGSKYAIKMNLTGMQQENSAWMFVIAEYTYNSHYEIIP